MALSPPDYLADFDSATAMLARARQLSARQRFTGSRAVLDVETGCHPLPPPLRCDQVEDFLGQSDAARRTGVSIREGSSA